MFSQPDTAVHPAQVRVEKVAVGCTDMIAWSSTGSAPQHHLVDHKLAVVLTYSALSFLKVRVRPVGTGSPLPGIAPELQVTFLAGNRLIYPAILEVGCLWWLRA